MSSPLEKSKDMQERYQKYGEDPWGNRERQLYQKIFKKATELTYQHLLPTIKTPENNDGTLSINLYDIGAGGGNIVDVWKENSPENVVLNIYGCDISQDAINFLNIRYPNSSFDKIDLEDYSHTVPLYNLKNADIVSIVDVMYYLGEKRDYKETLDEIWETIKPGAIVVVADNLVRAFRRDYLQKKHNCKVLESYTDYNEKICEEVSASGKHWFRYLKVRIYQKEG